MCKKKYAFNLIYFLIYKNDIILKSSTTFRKNIKSILKIYFNKVDKEHLNLFLVSVRQKLANLKKHNFKKER